MLPVVTYSTIPARLDRLPWSRWHWRVVIALGVAWVLDGLEVTIVGSHRQRAASGPTRSGLSAAQIGWAGSLYVAGAVIGALFFGRLADRLGRKRLFLADARRLHGRDRRHRVLDRTSGRFAFCRFLTGVGIGGEYAAINSAIDELIPARVRGRVDLAINGSFWIGAALGALLSLVLLDPRVLGPRAWAGASASLLGAVLARGDPAGAPLRAREPALAAGARPRRRGRAHRRADRGERRGAMAGRSRRCRRGRHPCAARGCRRCGEVAHVLLRRYPRRSARRASR